MTEIQIKAQMEDQTVNAWLIRTSDENHFSVGINEFKEIIQEPKLEFVPMAPRHCQTLIHWKEFYLPTFDLNILFSEKENHSCNNGPVKNVGIFIYQTQAYTPLRYGGIILEGQPKQICVSNEQACELPKDKRQWRPFTTSCFEQEDKKVPIICVQSLFEHNPNSTH